MSNYSAHLLGLCTEGEGDYYDMKEIVNFIARQTPQDGSAQVRPQSSFARCDKEWIQQSTGACQRLRQFYYLQKWRTIQGIKLLYFPKIPVKLQEVQLDSMPWMWYAPVQGRLWMSPILLEGTQLIIEFAHWVWAFVVYAITRFKLTDDLKMHTMIRGGSNATAMSRKIPAAVTVISPPKQSKKKKKY